MRVVVTGSRTWRNKNQIREWLIRIDPDTVIIHGDCDEGADNMVNTLATAMGFWIIKYPAPWRKFSMAAGPMRNAFMIHDSQPNCVKAFRAEGRSPGTDGVIEIAKSLNLPVDIEKEKLLE